MYIYIYILHTCFILKEYNTIEYKKDWFQVLQTIYIELVI